MAKMEANDEYTQSITLSPVQLLSLLRTTRTSIFVTFAGLDLGVRLARVGQRQGSWFGWGMPHMDGGIAGATDARFYESGQPRGGGRNAHSARKTYDRHLN